MSRAYFTNAELGESEQLISYLRLLLATILVVALFFDPTEPARYAAYTYTGVAVYVAYSVVVALGCAVSQGGSQRRSIAFHIVDVLAAAGLTTFTRGPSSTLFLTFGFAILAAGFRWGARETLRTGVASVTLYAAEALVVGASPLSSNLIEGVFLLNQFIVRITYLLVFTAIVGYFADQQKVSRVALAEVAASRERARLGRELHDGVTQSLIGVRMRLEVLRTTEASNPQLTNELRRLEALLSREIANLRTLMFERTPVTFGGADLAEVLREITDRFQHASGISTRLLLPVPLPRPSMHACHEISRIVQEALVNAQRHSGAANVAVEVTADTGVWTLTVTDDGHGFDFSGRMTHDDLDRERKGPRVLKERARLLGGTVAIDSSPGAGARVHVMLPLGV